MVNSYPQRIRNILVKNNIEIIKHPRLKNKFLNEEYFDNIDSEEKAYFLGLLFTDGSVVKSDKRSNTAVRLELNIKDIDIIKRLKKCLNCESDIVISKRTNRNGSISESALIAINSEKMSKALEKYGIIPNKTYKTTHLPKIDKKFLIPFLRGLIDGDGSICQTKTYNEKYQKYYYGYKIYFCSLHKTCCDDFLNLINQVLPEKIEKETIRNQNSYRISFSKKKDVYEIAKLLYKDSNVHLQRKYELAKSIFDNNNNNNEEDIVYSDN